MEYWLQRVTIYIVILAGLVLAVFAGLAAGNSDFRLILSVIAGLAVLALYFGVYRYYWIFTLTTIFIPGDLNFIPAGLQAFEVLLMLGVFRFAFDQVVFGSKTVQIGNKTEFICITALFLILFWHGANERFGMRIFGSANWGGRSYVGVIFAYFTYIIFQTVHFDLKAWKWLPLLVVIPSFLDGGVKILTKFVPSTAVYVYQVYGGVTNLNLDMTIGLVDDNALIQASRLGELASIGAPLLLVILAYFHLKDLWKPKYWIIFLLLVGCALLAVMGGYRSSVLGFFVVIAAGLFREYRWLAIVPLTVVTLLTGSIIAYHNYGGWEMPLSAQRALVFLPGKWDTAAVSTAKNSDEFRFETWEKWDKAHFKEKPLLGRGFGFPAEVMADILGAYDRRDDSLLRQTLLLTGELHNGFLSVVDRVGIVGAVFFSVWWVITLWHIFTVLNKPHLKNFNPALTWCALYLSGATLLYVVGSLRLDGWLSQQIVIVGLMNRLVREANLVEKARLESLKTAQAAHKTELQEVKA
jgi:uncharacterized membrane protein